MKIFVYKDNHGFIIITLSSKGWDFKRRLQLIAGYRRIVVEVQDYLFLYEKRKQYWTNPLY
jgi:hypothetical protein